MKQRTWILIFAALAAACLLVWLLPGRQAKLAAVYQDGQLIAQLDPHKDTQLRVSGPAGENIITVSGGEIRVTKADCPDQLCVLHGPLAERGGPIVCLPNHLSVQWLHGSSGVDAISGTGGLS